MGLEGKYNMYIYIYIYIIKINMPVYFRKYKPGCDLSGSYCITFHLRWHFNSSLPESSKFTHQTLPLAGWLGWQLVENVTGTLSTLPAYVFLATDKLFLGWMTQGEVLWELRSNPVETVPSAWTFWIVLIAWLGILSRLHNKHVKNQKSLN